MTASTRGQGETMEDGEFCDLALDLLEHIDSLDAPFPAELLSRLRRAAVRSARGSAGELAANTPGSATEAMLVWATEWSEDAHSDFEHEPDADTLVVCEILLGKLVAFLREHGREAPCVPRPDAGRSEHD